MIIKIAIGMGQFRLIKNVSLVIGRLDKLETIKEYKVEIICTNDHLNSVISDMKSAHSYEQVAYTVIKMKNQ